VIILEYFKRVGFKKRIIPMKNTYYKTLMAALLILGMTASIDNYKIQAEMISPIDAGAILNNYIQQQRYKEFEHSLMNMQEPVMDEPVIQLQTTAVILTDDDKKALEAVRENQEMNNYPAVISLSSKALKQNPKLTELLLDRGAAHFHLRNYSLALDDANLYLTNHPADIEGLLLKSASELMLRNFDQAILDSKKVLAKEKNAKAYEILSLAEVALQEDDKARKDAEKALKLDPEAKGAMLVLTILDLEYGHYEKAKEMATKIIDEDPESPYAYTARGFAEFHLDQYEAAKNDALKSNELYDDIAYNYVLLGKIYRLSHENHKSVQALTTAKELFHQAGDTKKSVEVELLLGEVYTEMNF
jgi:tetratricopeptide (TPR) repeat protein